MAWDDGIEYENTKSKAESFGRGFVGGVPFTNPIQAAVRAGAGQLGVPFIGSEPNPGETFPEQYRRLAREEGMENEQASIDNPKSYYLGLIGSALGMSGPAPGHSAKALKNMVGVKGALKSQAPARIAQGGAMGAAYSTNNPAETWSETGTNAVTGGAVGLGMAGLGELGTSAINKFGRTGFKSMKRNLYGMDEKLSKADIEKKLLNTDKEYGIFVEPRGRAMKKDFSKYIRDEQNKVRYANETLALDRLKNAALGSVMGYGSGSLIDYFNGGNTNFAHLLAAGGGGVGAAGKALYPLATKAAMVTDKAMRSPAGRQAYQRFQTSSNAANAKDNYKYPLDYSNEIDHLIEYEK